MDQKTVEDFVEEQLQVKSFEDLLSDFDLTPTEVFMTLFSLGLVDEEILLNRKECDYD